MADVTSHVHRTRSAVVRQWLHPVVLLILLLVLRVVVPVPGVGAAACTNVSVVFQTQPASAVPLAGTFPVISLLALDASSATASACADPSQAINVTLSLVSVPASASTGGVVLLATGSSSLSALFSGGVANLSGVAVSGLNSPGIRFALSASWRCTPACLGSASSSVTSSAFVVSGPPVSISFTTAPTAASGGSFVAGSPFPQTPVVSVVDANDVLLSDPIGWLFVNLTLLQPDGVPASAPLLGLQNPYYVTGGTAIAAGLSVRAAGSFLLRAALWGSENAVPLPAAPVLTALASFSVLAGSPAAVSVVAQPTGQGADPDADAESESESAGPVVTLGALFNTTWAVQPAVRLIDAFSNVAVISSSITADISVLVPGYGNDPATVLYSIGGGSLQAQASLSANALTWSGLGMFVRNTTAVTLNDTAGFVFLFSVSNGSVPILNATSLNVSFFFSTPAVVSFRNTPFPTGVALASLRDSAGGALSLAFRLSASSNSTYPLGGHNVTLRFTQISASPSSLGGWRVVGTSSVLSVLGLAAFPDVSLSGAGSYTATAVVNSGPFSGAASVTSDAFAVIPNPTPVQIRFAAVPLSGGYSTGGEPLFPQPQVMLLDEGGRALLR